MQSLSSSMARTRARYLAAPGLAAMSLALLSSPAFAQDASVVEAEGVAEEVAPATEEGIIVTGSRIRSVTPFNSPDPISIVSPEIAKQEGKLDLAAALQSSPI